MGVPLTARMVSGSYASAVPESLEHDPDRCPPEIRPAEQLEPAPHEVLGLLAEVPRGLRMIARPGVRPRGARSTRCCWPARPPRAGRRPRSGRAVAHAVDQLGVLPALLDLGHPTFQQAGQGLGDHPGNADRIGLPDPQVRGEIVGCQSSHRVGASGPTSSRRSHRAARSDLANVTSDHARALAPVSGPPRLGGRSQTNVSSTTAARSRMGACRPPNSTPRSLPASSGTAGAW